MTRKEKAESQKKIALTERSIFAGLTFHGKPVSKEEYLDHYEEYVKRCSDVKEANSLADELTPQRITDGTVNANKINLVVDGQTIASFMNSNYDEKFQESIFNRWFRFESLKDAKKFKKNNFSSNYRMEIVAFPSRETRKQIFGILFLRNNPK